jgi:hypothetical protein
MISQALPLDHSDLRRRFKVALSEFGRRKRPLRHLHHKTRGGSTKPREFGSTRIWFSR